MRRCQEFLGICPALVILETAGIAVRIGLQRLGLGADPAHPLLAPTLPMHRRGFVAHFKSPDSGN